MKRFCVGDIHGAHRALKQVLEKSNFDYEVDQLICLGDVVDGWPDSAECLEELFKIKNLIAIRGNHDSWCLNYYKQNLKLSELKIWLSHGGDATISSFQSNKNRIEHYINYLETTKLYHILDDDIIFVHGGVPPKQFNLEKTQEHLFTWDRDMITTASRYRQKKSIDKRWKEIYVGHTPIINFKIGELIPQKWSNVWAMDTSACFEGVLSMIDIDSKEIFQSEPCYMLYPKHKGRNKTSFNQKQKKDS